MSKGYYYIHKKVKKKEMIFEYTLLSVLSLLLIFLIVYGLDIWPSFTSNTDYVIVIGVFIAIYTLVWQVYSAIKAKRVVVDLGLNVSAKGLDILVTASITNAGNKSIYPLMTNLYISEGVLDDSHNDAQAIKFPSVTEHNMNMLDGNPCFECAVSKLCKEEAEEAKRNSQNIEPKFPPCNKAEEKEFKDTVAFAYNMKLLSYSSLIHVMPNETFTDEAVISLPKPGYYRIFMIYTDKEWKDCICRSSVVKVEN